MAIVVEDGTGLANADSYASVAFGDTYLASVGADATWSAAATTTALKEEALRVATQYLDITTRWRGRKKTSTQALDWPRSSGRDDEGYLIDDASVPASVAKAACELAERYLADDTVLLPDGTTATSAIRRERNKVGDIEEELEYVGSRRETTLFRKVEALLYSVSFPSWVQERA